MKPAEHTSRHCPICGSDQKKVLFQQHFSTVLLVQGYDVVVCENCGFGFADQIPEQKALDAYYRDLSKFEFEHRDGKESESDEKRLLDVARLLGELIPDPQARILDLGCSTGRLLAALKDSGFPNVWGLDPSPGCAEAARKLYDVPVFIDTFSGFGELDQKFDFVIMIGVLEHIRELESLLSVLKKIIRPNGRAYIDVPDATQFADWPDAPFQEFSTEHINFFSGRSLMNLMQMHGFNCRLSQKAQRSYTETTVMPSVEALFENDGVKRAAWVRDDESECRLQEYIRQSLQVDASIRGVLEKTANSKQPIIVWGIGTHTQRLLAAGALERLNICLFVDSNPKYHGEKLRGIPVVSPNELKARIEPILICSRVFQLEIERQAREELKLNNQLLLLYDLRDSQTA